MLILSRKPAESIHIGNNIVITVVRISVNSVRLGITAPKDMKIAREELIINLPEGQELTIEGAPSSAAEAAS